MSKVTASGKPAEVAVAAPATTPPAGPDRSRATGRGHHQHLVGQPVELAEVIPAEGPQVGVEDGRDGALVLAELG